MDKNLQRSKYEVDMCHGPLLKKIITYSLPLIFTGLLQLLYNAADIIVVGRFASSTALAAVGSTSSLVNLTVNLFLGLSVGVSVAVAQHYGAKNYTEVSETIHTAFSLSLILGVIVGTFGFFASRTMLEWMDSPAEVLEQSALYLRIFFLSIPASMVYNFGASILRAVGNTRQPLYYLSIAGVINVILNLVLVIRFHLGVAGVAIATVISQYISAGLIILCLMRTEGCLQFHPKQLALKPDKVWAILRIGLPAGLQSTVFSISNVLIQSSINSFGALAMAGSAAASNLEGFIYTAMNAISQAALAFVGQNVGGRQYHRIHRITWICLSVVFLVGVVMSAAFLAADQFLLEIYLPDDPAAVEYGIQRMFMVNTVYFFMGFIDVMVASMRGMGSSFTPMVVVLCGACGLRIVWIYTIFAANRTLEMLYLSYPASWIVTFLVELAFYFVVYRRLMARHKGETELQEADLAQS